jgi:hypothetical protein
MVMKEYKMKFKDNSNKSKSNEFNKNGLKPIFSGMSSRWGSLLVFILVLSGSCLEPFEFPIDDTLTEQLLVVDGLLTPSTGSQFFTLARTVSFKNKFIDPVLGASIVLNDTYPYTEIGDGKYELKNVDINVGESYFIDIRLSDGTHYKSLPTIMPRGIQPDSTFVRFENGIRTTPTGAERISKVMNVYLDTDLPNNDNEGDLYFRWLTEGLYVFPEESCGGLHQPKSCYIDVPPNGQDLVIQSSENIQGDRLINQRIATKNSFEINEFKALYILSTYQFSITKESFTYWSNLKTLANQSGTVFDLPPAALTGNMFNVDNPDELVLGYFEVADVDTIRASVLSSEFKSEINGIVPCSQFMRNRWPAECCECLVLDGATTNRPDWLN